MPHSTSPAPLHDPNLPLGLPLGLHPVPQHSQRASDGARAIRREQLLEQEINRALQPYEGKEPAAVLAVMRETLREALSQSAQGVRAMEQALDKELGQANAMQSQVLLRRALQDSAKERA